MPNTPPILPPVLPHFNFAALPNFQARCTFARVIDGIRYIFAGGQHGAWNADEGVWNERGGHWSGSVPEPREDRYENEADALAALRGVQGLRDVVANLSIEGATLETYQGEPLLRVASGTPIVPTSSGVNPYSDQNDYYAQTIVEARLYNAITGVELVGVWDSIANGSYILWAHAGGEWSAVRVRVGAGAWNWDETTFYPGPGCPLYETSMSGRTMTLANEADYSVNFDPMARAVTCSCVTHTAIRTSEGQFDIPAGSQLIAGLRASQSGPQTAVWLLRDDGTARLLAASPTFSDGRCECAKTNHHASDIEQAPDGRLFILSECNLSVYNPDGATAWERLAPYPESVDGHPGGQTLRFPTSDNAALPPTPTGATEPLFFTENFGGVNNGLAWYNRLVQRVGGVDYSGPSTLWHGPDCAEVWRGALWAVRGEKSTVGDVTTATLYLDEIAQGRWSGYDELKRETIARDGDEAGGTVEKWQRLRRAGKNLWVFGWRLNAGTELGEEVPVCRVTRGQTLDEAALPYFVRRATPDDAAGSLLLCARAEVDGIGVANRVIELVGASGDGGTRVCSFWNVAASEFRLSKSAFIAAGGDVNKLPAFYAWQPRIGSNGGGVWVVSEQPNAPYLATHVTGDIIGFALMGTIPYDVSQWGELCFEIRADGSTVEPDIETTVENAQEAIDKMPAGTKFILIEPLQIATGVPALSQYQVGDLSAPDASGYGGLTRERGIYPTLFARVDSTAPTSDLTSYTELVNYGRIVTLQRDARRSVGVLILVTPDNVPTAGAGLIRHA